MADLDHYEIYYADKLWNLIPAIYRSVDSENFGEKGPLREIVERIGAQAAVVRRSADRLWEDQSIETCDDWVIPYIADLLATNLVAGMGARGQRLDVAKTIYYRRRTGTVGILEEIAHDITGWDARVIEFFRRLGRTRHSFDPEIGLPSETEDCADNRKLQLAENIIGQWTGTPMGGWADLRNAYGAAQAQSPFGIYPVSRAPSAFDEYFHTADFRKGQGRSGWYNIQKLGVFLWRLQSFPVDFTTPVQYLNDNNSYTFDPTGREMPLFARSLPSSGADWVSRQEWQLPTPISTPLLRVALTNPAAQLTPQELAFPTLLDLLSMNLLASQPLYAADSEHVNALGIFTKPGSDYEVVPASLIAACPIPANSNPQVVVFPELGKFKTLAGFNGTPFVTYCYGFPSTIGAGSYDRRVLGQPAPTPPSPLTRVTGGGKGLQTGLTALTSTGTVQISDSLTYTAIQDVSNINDVTVITENTRRALIRTAPRVAKWAFTGNDNQSTLVLDGLFISGTDIVLQGTFATVILRCCTFDPGTAVDTAGTLAKAVDGLDLSPSHLWIEAKINQLIIDRCIVGPIATRAQGAIVTLTATDSIVQALGNEIAINLADGVVELSRCSVLGQAKMHHLSASESILDDLVNVENYQDGCVRFSAWSSGSVLPRQYESVQIAAGAPLFTSRSFGQPGYCQLQPGVDNAIIPPPPATPSGVSISAGAEDGSEMGAYANDKNPIKERSLLIKYQEFMPLGLVPIIIYVT